MKWVLNFKLSFAGRKRYPRLNDMFKNIISDNNVDPRDNNIIYLFPLSVSQIQRELTYGIRKRLRRRGCSINMMRNLMIVKNITKEIFPNKIVLKVQDFRDIVFYIGDSKHRLRRS